MRRLRLVFSALVAFGAAHPRPLPPPVAEGGGGNAVAVDVGAGEAKALCVRPHAVWWLDTAPKLRQARVRLRWHVAVARAVSLSRMENGELRPQKPLLVGVDTEWASPSEDFAWVAQVPALVQLCIGRQVWLLDVYGIFLSAATGLSGVAPLQELRGLLSDVFTAPPMPSMGSRPPGAGVAAQPKPSVVVVGFAFKEDLAKLRAIFTVAPHAQTRSKSVRGSSSSAASLSSRGMLCTKRRSNCFNIHVYQMHTC